MGSIHVLPGTYWEKEASPVLSRRDFLKTAGAVIGIGGVAVGTVAAAHAVMDQDGGTEGGNRVERHGNTTTISTNEGVFHLQYNLHGRDAGGEMKPRVNPDSLPENTGAVALETRSAWTQKPLDNFRHFSGEPQNEMPLREVGERGKPAYLLYPHLRGPETGKIRAGVMVVAGGVGGTAMALAAREHIKSNWDREQREPEQQRTLHRRALIRDAVGATLGVFGLSPLAANLGRSASTRFHGGHGVTASFSNTVNELHPVTRAFPDDRLCAAILAHKLAWLVKEQGLESIATVMGSDHAEVEQALCMTSAQRLERIVQYADFLRLDVVDDESVYRADRFDAHEVTSNMPKLWDITSTLEQPELRQLMKFLRERDGRGISEMTELREAMNKVGLV